MCLMYCSSQSESSSAIRLLRNSQMCNDGVIQFPSCRSGRTMGLCDSPRKTAPTKSAIEWLSTFVEIEAAFTTLLYERQFAE
jgi:hypothetical protein